MRASPNLYTTSWGQVSRQVGHRSRGHPSVNAADPSLCNWLHLFLVVVQNKTLLGSATACVAFPVARFGRYARVYEVAFETCIG